MPVLIAEPVPAKQRSCGTKPIASSAIDSFVQRDELRSHRLSGSGGWPHDSSGPRQICWTPVYQQLDMVDVDEDLARGAGELAEAHGLRGYDAIPLAAAHRVSDPDLVVVAGDRPLLAAATTDGLMTAPIG